jgi:adenylosuccinate lyase
LARVVRANAHVALENISTFSQRDISHSSAERIIFADSFQLVHFMLGRLKKVVDKLLVNEDRVKSNLEFTAGAVYSPEVKDLLAEKGMDPEEAYAVSQSLAFEAFSARRPYLEVLMASDKIPEALKSGILQGRFDLKKKLQHVPAIFMRFGL